MTANTKPEFCINTLVAKVLKDYIQSPTYEELKAEIQSQEYARLKLSTDTHPDGFWYAILYVTSDSVVVQDVLLKCEDTRFGVHVVRLDEWEAVFMEWIDEQHSRYEDCHYEFKRGMRAWGARI